MLPMGLGYVEGVTHDYMRHGTTTLFAALNVLNGAVLAECKPRHRHQEFLSFLREIDKAVPAELDIHCIVDNYATHKSPQGEGLAGSTSALAHALHSDLQLLAQPGRALLLADHRQGHPPRLVHLGQGTGARSITSSPTTTRTASRSRGLPPPIRYSESSADFAHESAGQDTSG